MKKKPLFNFKEFVSELHNDEEKRQFIEDLEKYYGDLSDKDYTELPVYRNFISKIDADDDFVSRFMLPARLKDRDGWPLLFRLVAVSSSLTYAYEQSEKTGMLRLAISAEGFDDGVYKKVTKYLDQLKIDQIRNLYKHWFEEQLRYALLCEKNKENRESIYREWASLLKAFRIKKARTDLKKTLAPVELSEKFKKLIQID